MLESARARPTPRRTSSAGRRSSAVRRSVRPGSDAPAVGTSCSSIRPRAPLRLGFRAPWYGCAHAIARGMSRAHAVSFVLIVLFSVAAVIAFRSYLARLASLEEVWSELLVVLSLLACMYRLPAPRAFTRTTAEL